MSQEADPSPGAHELMEGPAKVTIKKTFFEYTSEDGSNSLPASAFESATKTCPVFAQRTKTIDEHKKEGQDENKSEGPGDRDDAGASSAGQTEKGTDEDEVEMRTKLSEGPAKITVRKTFIEFDDGDGEASPGGFFDVGTKTCPVFNRTGHGEPSFDSEDEGDQSRPPPGLEDHEGAAYGDQSGGLLENAPSNQKPDLPAQKVKVRNTFIEWESEEGGGTPTASRLDPTRTCPVFARRIDPDEEDDAEGEGEAGEAPQQKANQPAKVDVMNTIAEGDESGGAAASRSRAKPTKRPSVKFSEASPDAETFVDPEDHCSSKAADLPSGPAKVKIRNTFIDLDEDEATKSTVIYSNPMATCPVFSMRRGDSVEQDEEEEEEEEEEVDEAAKVGPRGGYPPEAGPGEAAASEETGPGAQAPSMSRGSALHDVGRCEPCAWYWKPGGCRSGPKCRRCHMCPAGELKARRKVKNSMLRVWKHAPMPGLPGAGAPGMTGLPPMPGFEDPSDIVMDDPGIGIITQEVVGLRGALTQADFRESSPTLHVPAVPPEMMVGMGFPDLSAGYCPPMMPMMPLDLAGVAPMEPILNSGSVLHVLGRCEPCAWFWRPGGCKSGQECRRCHLCPPGEVKARKKAKNRALHEILAKMAADGVAADES